MRRSGRRDLGQKLRAAKRERDDARDRLKSLRRQVDEDKGIVIEQGRGDSKEENN